MLFKVYLPFMSVSAVVAWVTPFTAIPTVLFAPIDPAPSPV